MKLKLPIIERPYSVAVKRDRLKPRENQICQENAIHEEGRSKKHGGPASGVILENTSDPAHGTRPCRCGIDTSEESIVAYKEKKNNCHAWWQTVGNHTGTDHSERG